MQNELRELAKKYRALLDNEDRGMEYNELVMVFTKKGVVQKYFNHFDSKGNAYFTEYKAYKVEPCTHHANFLRFSEAN